MDTDGLMLQMLQRFLPLLETCANRVLRNLDTFALRVRLEDRLNNVMFYIERGDMLWEVSMGSGYEQFVCSLALRIALAKMSHVSKPNFLVVDEGWTAFDKVNLAKVPRVLEALRHEYDMIWMISHLEELQEQVDVPLWIRVDAVSGDSAVVASAGADGGSVVRASQKEKTVKQDKPARVRRGRPVRAK